MIHLSLYPLVIGLLVTSQLGKFPEGNSYGEVSARRPDQSAVFNIKDALPAGYVKNGSVDYTDLVQKAIDTHSDIIFPGFPLLVNDKGLVIGSNKNITFETGAKIVLKPTRAGSYAILRMRNVSNITITNPVIYGDRKQHLGKDGQWGAGIGIFSATNITIKNPKVYDCWGDGIYIGEDMQQRRESKNIIISGAYCRNNRRNGISIVSVDGLQLISPYAGYTNGQSPMCGIDVEPNNDKNVLKHISITDAVTERNESYGILMNINRLYGGGDNQVDVTVKNHNDNFSAGGLRVIAYRLKANNGGNLGGNIAIINPHWNSSSKRALDATGVSEKNLRLKFSGVKISSAGKRELDSNQTRTLIMNSVSKKAGLEFSH